MGTKDERIAVGVVRQSRGDGESPQAQAKRIREACERDGLRLLKIITEQDVSGGTPLEKRKGLLEAITLIEGGKAQVLIGAYFDRLVRSLKVQAEMVDRVEAKGGRVLALDTGEVTNGSAGQWLSGTMIGAVAEYHRRATGERVRDAQAAAIAAGVPPYGRPTTGYTQRRGRPLQPHPKHAGVVAEGFRMRADDDASVQDVRRHLRQHGITLSHAGVTQLLRSRVVLGELHFGKLENLRAHTGIVDPDVWKRAQDQHVPRGPRAKSDALLARLGVLLCSGCGSRMTIGNTNGYATYRCPLPADCPRGVAVMMHIADDAVRGAVREILADAEGHASVDVQARTAKTRADAADEELARKTRIAMAGASDDPEVEATLAGLKAKAERLRHHADELEALSGSEVVTVADLDDADLGRWRRLIRATLATVTVAPGRGRDRFTFEPRRQPLDG